jgi:Ca2+-binding EF-hand superfamily protein
MEQLYGIKMLDKNDVCKILKIGRQKCDELFKSSTFPSINIMGTERVKADSFNQFLSNKQHIKREERLAKKFETGS